MGKLEQYVGDLSVRVWVSVNGEYFRNDETNKPLIQSSVPQSPHIITSERNALRNEPESQRGDMSARSTPRVRARLFRAILHGLSACIGFSNGVGRAAEIFGETKFSDPEIARASLDHWPELVIFQAPVGPARRARAAKAPRLQTAAARFGNGSSLPSLTG